MRNDPDVTNNGFTQEQLPSGRVYWSDSPRTDNEIPHLAEDPQVGDNMTTQEQEQCTLEKQHEMTDGKQDLQIGRSMEVVAQEEHSTM